MRTARDTATPGRLPLARGRWRRLTAVMAMTATTLASGGQLRAWVYPEHEHITLLAVQDLNPERREALDQLWSSARHGFEQRLCAVVADRAQAPKPSCLDWTAWPAIAGDHSCSGADMLSTILESRWILDVARVAAHLREDLAGVDKPTKRVNVLRSSDIQFQHADPGYATRAASNNVHFLLARPGPETTGAEYARLSVTAGTELNAVGGYAFYHLAALQQASRLSSARLDGDARARLARAVLANEAFALHFLEDAFAAGHVAGTWGNQAIRKGTHDYYNERSLEAMTWDQKTVVLEGDAHLGEKNARRAANTVRASIAQMIDAARGRSTIPYDAGAALEPNPLNVCRSGGMPSFDVPPEVVPLWIDVVHTLPAAALAEGPGALPRFRAEIGPFIGVSASAGVSWIDGGYAAAESTSGVIGALTAGVRLGLGLEGVMDQAGDGLVFIDVGLRQDTASSVSFSDNPALTETGAFSSTIPARGGITIRARVPFWLIPGDLLVGALFVAPFSRSAYRNMAIVASNGGLIPWQSGLATPVGRFQLVLGREVGVTLYGYLTGKTRMLMPAAVPGASQALLVALQSIAFDFPVLEYRPFQSFSMDQASELIGQLFVGFETPGSSEVIAPAGTPVPELNTIFNAGLRVAFDWRRY